MWFQAFPVVQCEVPQVSRWDPIIQQLQPLHSLDSQLLVQPLTFRTCGYHQSAVTPNITFFFVFQTETAKLLHTGSINPQILSFEVSFSLQHKPLTASCILKPLPTCLSFHLKLPLCSKILDNMTSLFDLDQLLLPSPLTSVDVQPQLPPTDS